ncbi:hypothetical protein HN011_006960 [Eciton burchellii]|nr:hypothetical protein HN011_006960 [Eciton burchellii]
MRPSDSSQSNSREVLPPDGIRGNYASNRAKKGRRTSAGEGLSPLPCGRASLRYIRHGQDWSPSLPPFVIAATITSRVFRFAVILKRALFAGQRKDRQKGSPRDKSSLREPYRNY